MTAREDYAKLHANTSGPHHQGETSTEAQAALDEIDRLRDAFNPEVTFRDLEMKMRDGHLDIRTMADPEIDTTAHAAGKFLAALMLRFLLDDGDVPPPNYRVGSVMVKPAGQFEEMRTSLEVLTPGRPSSHDIRLQLEEKMARALEVISGARLHVQLDRQLREILDHTPAPVAAMPHRIRLSRESGARMPPNSKSVARPSKWGNPFKIVRDHATWKVEGSGRTWTGYETVDEATMAAVELFRYAWEHKLIYMNHLDITELAGFNLGCYCPLDKPCHADVLLELANGAH